MTASAPTVSPTSAPASPPRHLPLDPGAVTLDRGRFRTGQESIRRYLLSLENPALLQNYRIEAGLSSVPPLRTSIGGEPVQGDEWHWGWETPGTQMRGHFLGHWLSAASRMAAAGDSDLSTKVTRVLDGLRECQIANGGEWVFSIPVRYLERLAAGDPIWAPQYTMHKTLMGLVDAYRYLGAPVALEIADSASRWIHGWSEGFTREQFDDLLDEETGGMLEVWADLLEFTGDPMYRDLLRRYHRSRLFEPLLRGEDALTNRHANTTIPEALGAARAYEVTGDEEWRRIATAYWHAAVEMRGTFCTGGQTTGEVWNPPHQYAARRGPRNQEHCVVYNMIRLAGFLFRWTGEARYLDYIELNNLNGVLAQQHPETGMIAYFLPLAGGSRKFWGRPTSDFWCCHGTLVQAHATREDDIFYLAENEVTVAQYISSTAVMAVGGEDVQLSLDCSEDRGAGGPSNNQSSGDIWSRPNSWTVGLRVRARGPVRFTLRIRVPGWAQGTPLLAVDGEPVEAAAVDGFVEIDRTWHENDVTFVISKAVTVHRIPDEPDTVAFLDGPVVLAGLVDAEVALVGDPEQPERLLAPDNEREWSRWLSGYRTVGQARSISMIPLNEVVDQQYSVYFPVLAG